MTQSQSHKTADTTIISGWLDIPADCWPPDHYTLLGLSAGETDVTHIEQQVQQRLERVRRYQLCNPEAATEAMNRLAQAFVCLTDPQARRIYDRCLFGEPVAVPSEQDNQKTSNEGRPPRPSVSPEAIRPAPEIPPLSPSLPPRKVSAATQKTLLDIPAAEEVSEPVLFEVPELPDPGPVDPELLALVEEEARAEELRAAAAAIAAGSATPAAKDSKQAAGEDSEGSAEPPDHLVEAARSSHHACRGLGTKRALYFRMARTRALLRAWDQAGKYLNQPQRRLKRPAEARDLLRSLAAIRRELANFPPLVGEAGQPGYLVIALARQPTVVPTFQTLLPSQREALSRDWTSAQKVLTAHKDFLRHELKVLRRKTIFGRGLRAFRAFLNEHPASPLILLGLTALAVVLWRQFL
jgi:hypothetical protein